MNYFSSKYIIVLKRKKIIKKMSASQKKYVWK